MNEPKYKTLAELVSAIKDGSLDVKGQELSLVIDNDNVSMDFYDEDDPDNDVCYFANKLPSDVLTEALDILGIPWDNV